MRVPTAFSARSSRASDRGAVARMMPEPDQILADLARVANRFLPCAVDGGPW